MPRARYRYIGADSECREECLCLAKNFDIHKGEGTLVKDDLKSTVIRAEVWGDAVFCKRFNHGGFFRCIKNQFRRSKAAINYLNAVRAQELDIEVPEHIAAVEKRVFGFLVESFLITRSIDGAIPLQRFIENEFPADGEVDLCAKHIFIESLAGFIAHVHSKGMIHNDLKGANVVVRKAGGGYEFHILDLDCVSFAECVPRSCIVRNLVQLNNDCQYVAGEFDRLRFFTYYLRKSGLKLSREERKSMTAEIVRLTKVKVDRWRRESERLERKGKSKHIDESINLGG